MPVMARPRISAWMSWVPAGTRAVPPPWGVPPRPGCPPYPPRTLIGAHGLQVEQVPHDLELVADAVGAQKVPRRPRHPQRLRARVALQHGHGLGGGPGDNDGNTGVPTDPPDAGHITRCPLCPSRPRVPCCVTHRPSSRSRPSRTHACSPSAISVTMSASFTCTSWFRASGPPNWDLREGVLGTGPRAPGPPDPPVPRTGPARTAAPSPDTSPRRPAPPRRCQTARGSDSAGEPGGHGGVRGSPQNPLCLPKPLRPPKTHLPPPNSLSTPVTMGVRQPKGP